MQVFVQEVPSACYPCIASKVEGKVVLPKASDLLREKLLKVIYSVDLSSSFWAWALCFVTGRRGCVTRQCGVAVFRDSAARLCSVVAFRC